MSSLGLAFDFRKEGIRLPVGLIDLAGLSASIALVAQLDFFSSPPTGVAQEGGSHSSLSSEIGLAHAGGSHSLSSPELTGCLNGKDIMLFSYCIFYYNSCSFFYKFCKLDYHLGSNKYSIY